LAQARFVTALQGRCFLIRNKTAET
jgi:hypothetical protein